MKGSTKRGKRCPDCGHSLQWDGYKKEYFCPNNDCNDTNFKLMKVEAGKYQ